MTKYEAPRITDYGTLAELTAVDPASGGALPGQGLSLSGVPNTAPGGGTDLPPANHTAPPPAPPPGGDITATTTAPPPPPGGELTATTASVTGPQPTSGAGELQSAVPTGAEGAITPVSGSPSGPDAPPGDAGSQTTPEATISPGDLPFTGGAVGVVAALGGVLTATGAALRRAVNRR